MKVRFENWQIYTTSGDSANPRYASFQDDVYIDTKDFGIDRVCAYPEFPSEDTKWGGTRSGTISLKFISGFGGYREDKKCNIYTRAGAFLTTGTTEPRTIGDTTTMFSAFGTGPSLDNTNSISLIDVEGNRTIGKVNVYFFEDSEHAIAYLNSANKDFYAKSFAWNYDDVWDESQPLNTTFTVYHNSEWKPKTVIRWKSKVIGTNKKYNAEDVRVIIRAWDSIDLKVGTIEEWTPALPTDISELPEPLPDGAQILFSGKFSTGKFEISWDKLQKIFKTISPALHKGYIFDMYCTANDGTSSRHTWAYMTNNNAIQYNKVKNSAWKAGVYVSTLEDQSIAVIGTGDGESDDGYEDFKDTIESSEAARQYSAVGALTQSYAMTLSKLKLFGDYLWNANVFSNIKLMNNSPIENVIACKYFPMTFTGTDENLKLGNVDIPIAGAKLTSGAVYTFDVGTVNVSEYYHSFLDHAPYTSLTIFLPFIGFQSIPTELFMGHSLNVKYIVDVITGAVKAIIFRDEIEVINFSGTIGIDIAVSAQNRAQVEMGYISTIANTAISVAGTVATGGATAPIVAGQIVSGGLDMAQSQYHTSTQGTQNPACSAGETLQCYIIIDRPIYQDLSAFNHAYGRMCNLSQNLANLSGFTQCNANVDVSGIECTSEERQMIKDFLVGGVIL